MFGRVLPPRSVLTFWNLFAEQKGGQMLGIDESALHFAVGIGINIGTGSDLVLMYDFPSSRHAMAAAHEFMMFSGIEVGMWEPSPLEAVLADSIDEF